MTRTIVRWNPFVELSAFNRAFGDRAFGDWPYHSRHDGETELTFPVDISQTSDSVVVKAALPGLKAEDVDISVEDGVLTIKGEKKSEEMSEGENYYRREIRYGAFSRSVALPSEVDHEKAAAAFTDGVLTVTLPKAEEAKPRMIKISVN